MKYNDSGQKDKNLLALSKENFQKALQLNSQLRTNIEKINLAQETFATKNSFSEIERD